MLAGARGCRGAGLALRRCGRLPLAMTLYTHTHSCKLYAAGEAAINNKIAAMGLKPGRLGHQGPPAAAADAKHAAGAHTSPGGGLASGGREDCLPRRCHRWRCLLLAARSCPCHVFSQAPLVRQPPRTPSPAPLTRVAAVPLSTPPHTSACQTSRVGAALLQPAGLLPVAASMHAKCRCCSPLLQFSCPRSAHCLLCSAATSAVLLHSLPPAGQRSYMEDRHTVIQDFKVKGAAASDDLPRQVLQCVCRAVCVVRAGVCSAQQAVPLLWLLPAGAMQLWDLLCRLRSVTDAALPPLYHSCCPHCCCSLSRSMTATPAPAAASTPPAACTSSLPPSPPSSSARQVPPHVGSRGGGSSACSAACGCRSQPASQPAPPAPTCPAGHPPPGCQP